MTMSQRPNEESISRKVYQILLINQINEDVQLTKRFSTVEVTCNLQMQIC